MRPFFSGTDAGTSEIIFGPHGAPYVRFMCDQGWHAGRALILKTDPRVTPRLYRVELRRLRRAASWPTD